MLAADLVPPPGAQGGGEAREDGADRVLRDAVLAAAQQAAMVVASVTALRWGERLVQRRSPAAATAYAATAMLVVTALRVAGQRGGRGAVAASGASAACGASGTQHPPPERPRRLDEAAGRERAAAPPPPLAHPHQGQAVAAVGPPAAVSAYRSHVLDLAQQYVVTLLGVVVSTSVDVLTQGSGVGGDAAASPGMLWLESVPWELLALLAAVPAFVHAARPS